MSVRRTARRLALAVALALALAPGPAAAEPVKETPPEGYAMSPGGHLFRVGFDPGSRVWLGLAGALDRGAAAAPVGAFEIDAGISYRTRSTRGEGQDEIVWKSEHRFIAGWVHPTIRTGALPAFDAAVYGISWLRHDASSSIMLPTSPPLGIPFHFDVGVEAEAGRVTTLAYAAGASALRVGVVNAAIVLDPWRSPVPGRTFEIGLGLRYDVDVATGTPAPLTPGTTTPLAPAVVHRLAPMTAGMVRFRIQTRDGLTVFDCRGDVVPHYSSEGKWRFLALSSLHLERALIAVNDQPIAAVLEGGYRLDPPRQGVNAVSDFRVSLGLTMNLGLR